ncbi:MAG: haloacid dehalogenase type II [Burkholderiaceae bacterium]
MPQPDSKPASVLFFDVNETLLDLSPMKKRIDDVLLTDGAATLWFTTMLQYSLVMTVSEQYASLAEIAAVTLQMLGKTRDVVISDSEAQDIIGSMRTLPAHPDVPSALVALKEMGFRCVALTNSSDSGVSAQLANAGIADCFERQLSVETVRRFKPHQSVYLWAVDQMGTTAADAMLVAAHGWDVAGAKWAGLQTAFVERPGQHLFSLAPEPDLHVADLNGLVDKLK